MGLPGGVSWNTGEFKNYKHNWKSFQIPSVFIWRKKMTAALLGCLSKTWSSIKKRREGCQGYQIQESHILWGR